MSTCDPRVQQAISDRLTCFCMELSEGVIAAGERLKQLMSELETEGNQ